MKKAIELLREAGVLVEEWIISTAYSITVNPGRNTVDIQGDMDSDKVKWLNEKTEIKVNEYGIMSGELVTDKLTVRVVLS